MWIHTQQFTRLVAISLVSVCALAAGGYGAICGYKNWKEKRLLNQARQFLSEGQARQAVLCVQQAVANNPNSVTSCRMMSEVAEECGSPVSVYYRGRVADLQPAGSNQFEVVRTALKFGEFSTAGKSLANLTNSGNLTPEIHRLAADYFFTTHDYPRAEAHLAAALKATPNDVSFQFALASLQLKHGTAAKIDAARETLARIAAGTSPFKSGALRLLAADALDHSDKAACYQWLGALLAPTSPFEDKMLQLRAVSKFEPALADARLSAFEQDCGRDPAAMQTLASWMLGNNREKEAATWLRTKPPELLKQQPLIITYGECLAMEDDWSAVQALVQSGNWGRRESFRLALLARALRAAHNELGSKVEWRRALKAASMDLDQHLQLVRLTGIWQWEPESEEVLWQVVNTWSTEKWAFLSLAKLLAIRGNTAGLQSLYAKVSASDPGNLAVLNNWVMVTLLLSPSDKSAHQKARDLYKMHAANPVLASTYAFSLLLQDQKAEALEVFKKLPPRALNDPSLAVYYGLILNACGKAEDARPLLEAANKTLLLPEEKQLVARALGSG